MRPEEIVSGTFYELSGSVTVDREDTVFYRVPVQAVREGIHLILKMVDTDELKGEVGWIFEDLSYEDCGHQQCTNDGWIVDAPTGDRFMLEEVK